MDYQSLRGKRLLGLDYGEKKTGTALFTVGVDPFPVAFERLISTNKQALLNKIKNILEDECIDLIILGFPTYLDGKTSEMSKKVLSFQKELANFIPHPIFLQDETLTSHEAEERMKSDPRYLFKVDKLALDNLCAVILLEDFISQVQRGEKTQI